MASSYALGIDLGTTFTAAAIARDGRVDIVSLGDRSPAVPSVVLVREDGEVLVGEAAERRSVVEPNRSAREFKRRIGDPVPMLLGGVPLDAGLLLAHMARNVVDRVAVLEGGRPSITAVTHPANYGEFKRDLLAGAMRQAGIGEFVFLTEPEAAAVHYAGRERLEPGQVVVVYDLGGGTFDSAVLRKTVTGFEMLGQPEGIDRLGGIDFDQAVLAYVDSALGGAIGALDMSDPGSRSALARLRDDCRAAKEGLSTDSDVAIPVLLPGQQTEVRLTRAEFERMVRPPLVETVAAMDRSVRSAGLTLDQVDRILLVGGSSRIPLIAELLRESTGRPVAVDAHPKFAIASGAAMVAAAHLAGPAEVAPVPTSTPEPVAPFVPVAPLAPVVPEVLPTVEPALVAAPDASAPPPVWVETPAAPVPAASGGRGRGPLLIGLAVLVALVVAGIVLLGGGDDGQNTAAGPGDATTSTTGSTDTTDAETATTAATTGTTEAEATTTTRPEPTTTTLPDVVLGPSGRGARIDAITIEGDHYAATFRTGGFDALISDDESSHHLHFFFDTVDPDQAGAPGTGPWVIWDVPSTYTGSPLTARPDGATQLCVLVANHHHEVEQDTGNCVDLPDS